MKPNIKYIANVQNPKTVVNSDGSLTTEITSESKYTQGLFVEFIIWWDSLSMYQLDIETDITEWWNTRKLISLQFGTAELTRPKEQWFLQWSALTEQQKQIIIDRLNKCRRLKLIQNGRYEYIVLRFYGIILENIFDTMLAEKVINGGMAQAEYALADISWKYLRISMNKEQQTQFGDDIITDEKILYGCTDVMYLDVIMRQQIEAGEEIGQLNVMGLEMDALQAFADTTYEGMMLDVQKWRDNLQEAYPIVQAATDKINGWLSKEPFKTYAHQQGFVCDTDRLTLNYNSHEQKRAILQRIFPDLKDGTKVIIQKYIRENAKSMSAWHLGLLNDAMKKDYAALTQEAIANHRDWLIEKEFLIPAGQVTINWNSQPQVLPLMRLVEPKLEGLDEESINETTHPALRDLQGYRKATKLITSFGEEFIHKYMGPDGKVRTNFNQIIDTGRCSSSNPNMQQIIVGDKISNERDPNGTRYRNAFICEPGWKFVDGDYISQELVIIAYISQDPVWMECIANGWDLHSVCADLVYKKKWKDAAAEDCAYYRMVVGPDGKLVQNKQKCKCKAHKALRDSIKPINFGLAYGMTQFKLAGELQITVKEAIALIEEYFRTFPKIGAVLEFMGNFGIKNGYVPTRAPFYRRRYYQHWREYANYIEPHLQGIYHVPGLAKIGRQSKNHPIQGTSADIVKVAMVLVRNYIRDNNLRDIVKFQAQVHDQITTKVREDFAEQWRVILNDLMWEAGKLVIPTGILKADVQVTPVWTK